MGILLALIQLENQLKISHWWSIFAQTLKSLIFTSHCGSQVVLCLIHLGQEVIVHWSMCKPPTTSKNLIDFFETIKARPGPKLPCQWRATLRQHSKYLCSGWISSRNNFVADLLMSQTGLSFCKISLLHVKYLELAPLTDLMMRQLFSLRTKTQES